jgi:hypothetical protein
VRALPRPLLPLRFPPTAGTIISLVVLPLRRIVWIKARLISIRDEGWRTLATTTPSSAHVRNYGLGLVGYTWEENGPPVPVRKKLEALSEAVEKLARLPFVDVLYIRCDWRNVQSRPGRLDLHPVWELTLDAARRHGLRFAFRIQLSNPEFQPDEIALPAFLRESFR